MRPAISLSTWTELHGTPRRTLFPTLPIFLPASCTRPTVLGSEASDRADRFDLPTEGLAPGSRDGVRVLGAFAHPDDEGFGCGGTLSMLAGRGAEVTVVCFTDGDRAAGAAAVGAHRISAVRS